MSNHASHGGGARRGLIGLVAVVAAAVVTGAVGWKLDWWGGEAGDGGGAGQAPDSAIASPANAG